MAQEKYDDVEAGEMVDLEEDEPEVVDTEDGGAIIRLNEEDHTLNREHFANIADDIEPSALNSVCAELLDLIAKDKEARAKRDEQYEEGIRRTGLGNDAPGGAQFTGANKVVHPLLTEVCVDFSARVMKELLPPNGPVKTKIIGKTTKEKLSKAERKAAYMNWQLTEQMKEFRSELEQLSTQVPLGGVQYLKLFWSDTLQRVESEFVPVDDVYLPFAASNFYTAERRTHVQYITQATYNKRVKSGQYREVDLGLPDEIEQSKSAKANDKIEGRKFDSYNEDGLRTVFEVTTCLDLEGEEVLPYVIVIDKATSKALAVYRNWDPRDDNKEALINMVEFPFLPWRGAYPIGMTHMIGSLSGSATGALRALLDSAHIQNVPTLLKLKGGPSGQNLNPQPTEVTEIDGGTMADDIRKIIMQTPFAGPSPTLFQLLGFLVEAGKGVVRTSFENLSDQNPNQPVGTTVALIEQGMVVFSSIHARLHNSMNVVLKVIHRLNSAYLTDELIHKQFGSEAGDEDEREEMLVRPEDFDGPMDVVPVSNPNIFSETQRFAQIQAVMQRASALPMVYDIRKVEELFLKQLKIPEAEELLLPKPEPKDLSPIEENVAAAVGKPIGPLPQQNHIAHIKVHLAFIRSGFFGGNPIIAPRLLPALVEHIKDHLLLHYMSMVTKGIELAENSGRLDGEDEMQQADAAVQVQQALEQALGPEFLQVWQQAYQEAQKYRPPQPMDPNQAAAQVQQMAIQQRSQEAQQRGQIDQAKLQQSAQLEQVKLQDKQQERQERMQERREQEALEMQKEALRQQAEDQRQQEELQARMIMNKEDNETAKELAAVEVLSGEKIGYSSGTGINPNPTP